MFFSIQRLTERVRSPFNDPGDQLIGIWVAGTTVYWACYDEQRRPHVEKGTQGYVLFFSKTLLLGDKRDFYGSFLASFCPLPAKGEIVQVEKDFLREGEGICEMMYPEFEKDGGCKQALGELLRLFLLLLIRSSNGFVYVGKEQWGISYAS